MHASDSAVKNPSRPNDESDVQETEPEITTTVAALILPSNSFLHKTANGSYVNK